MIPDLLRSAADAIEQNGWTQRTDMDPNTGGVCANGALRLAVGHTSYQFGGERHVIGIPADWNGDQMFAADRQVQGAHKVLSRYMHDVHDYGDSEASLLQPSIIQYNDKVAQSGAEVAGIMRAAAEWVESHPLALLTEIEQNIAVYKALADGPEPALV